MDDIFIAHAYWTNSTFFVFFCLFLSWRVQERGNHFSRFFYFREPRETAYQDQILVNSKPVHTHYRRKHKRRGHKHHKRHNHSLKKKLSAIFEETDAGDQVCG